jgi:hypothetical protein
VGARFVFFASGQAKRLSCFDPVSGAYKKAAIPEDPVFGEAAIALSDLDIVLFF